MLPAVIGGAASLLGGAVSAFGQASANRQTAESAAADRALQLKFAQSGVRWRAMDAMKGYEKTGLHPLALLGVQPVSYSPQSVQFGNVGGELGRGMQSAGQEVSRAMLSTQDARLREQALAMQRTQVGLQAERGALENEILKLQIVSMQQRLKQQSMPGIPDPHAVDLPGAEKTSIPDTTLVRTPRGGFVVLPSEAAQQRMEEILGLGTEWFARHRASMAEPGRRQIISSYLEKRHPPPYGMEWRYSPETGEWLPQYKDYPDRARRFPDPKWRKMNRPLLPWERGPS